MISFMNLLSCLRMPIDRNTWREAIEIFGNVCMDLWVFYLTKSFRRILYIILVLPIISFLLFMVHFYDKNLGLMEFLSLRVDSMKGTFFSKFSNKCCKVPHVRMFFCWLLSFISVILLVLSGETETNPGPDPGYPNRFSFCHWNLNSIAAHNFIKMFLLQSYNTIHRFDIICLSETYLDNSNHSDDDQLTFLGYKLIRADNPNNIKKGGVCINYQEILTVKVIDVNILNEYLVCELFLESVATV